MNTRSVAVVGGGLAGLSAAYRLLEHNDISVDLFEASDRLGGRVHSRMIRGHAVDFGGFLIYPWYEACHALLRDLEIDRHLAKTPLNDVYYFLGDDTVGCREDELNFSKRDTVKLWGKSMLKILPNTELSAPDLERFQRKTISEYLRDALDAHAHAGLYETFFDTVNQGYCYGAVTQTKAAFMAPIVRQVTFHGDIRSTFFFPDGSGTVIRRLEDAIRTRGGTIHLNSPIDHLFGTVMNHRDTRPYDAIVFAQRVSHDLYRQILPSVNPDCSYTQYLTVAIECAETPTVGNTHAWGAAFYEPNAAILRQTHSIINLSSLYGTDLRNCLILNVVLRTPRTEHLDPQTIRTLVEHEIRRLFPTLPVIRVLDAVHWTHTMPISQESFVAAVREAQGTNQYYFAGDYLGAPSIETAIATGHAAAKAVLTDISMHL